MSDDKKKNAADYNVGDWITLRKECGGEADWGGDIEVKILKVSPTGVLLDLTEGGGFTFEELAEWQKGPVRKGWEVSLAASVKLAKASQKSTGAPSWGDFSGVAMKLWGKD